MAAARTTKATPKKAAASARRARAPKAKIGDEGNAKLSGRELLSALRSLKRGDVSCRLSAGLEGIDGQVVEAFNDVVDVVEAYSEDLAKLSRSVSTGRTRTRMSTSSRRGIWSEQVDAVNEMVESVTHHTSEMARVVAAVSNGDLTQGISTASPDVALSGDFLKYARIVNGMVEQLGVFGSEVTRVAREVGVEGKLGAQAEVKGVSGTWKELTDNVNQMAGNLTNQVRDLAKVTTAIAQGNLSQKISVEVKGEILELKNTINVMVDQLSSFAEEVTRVARDAGVEGKLGGQAEVPGAAGIWRDLTDNVNELAGNLTNQVRSIGDVATAVTKGDYGQSATVEGRGELALLKDNLNQMIGTLAETTRVNQEQDWLKTNLTRFSRMLHGQRDLSSVARQVMSELAKVIGAQHGVFYIAEKGPGDIKLKLYASYAYKERKSLVSEFKVGEGLVGQCALEKDRILLSDVPPDYIQVNSGLGEAPPANIAVVPVMFEGDVKGVVELATFDEFAPIQLSFLEQLFESLGIVLASIEATQRTEELLKQSQRLTEELQTQHGELQPTNEEIEAKARQVAEQKTEIERKNEQFEFAQAALEAKAEQLSLTSKYKSEFLANMSHELRTPLNALLILSQQLTDNREENLTEKQVEFARTIHGSGKDLLSLINEVLELAKVETGTMRIDSAEVGIQELHSYMTGSFRQMATDKGIEFSIDVGEGVPSTMFTDGRRLQQVLKNLLSNAFKFTEEGSVTVQVRAVESGWSPGTETLDQADVVVAFSVVDSGIGIDQAQQRRVFEAFQQAQGGTNRKYGGTGLGLSISREIATLLGGEIRLESTPGEGSSFTFFLPRTYRAVESVRRRTERRPLDAPHTPAPEDTPDGEALLGSPSFPDDRDELGPDDRCLLIIEDDEAFAKILADQARKKGFRVLVALTGTEGLALATRFKPHAVTLDLQLPDTHGWVVLDRLKHNPELRHIPVHVMSVEEEETRARVYGAIAFLRKPADQEALDGALAKISGFVERKVKPLLIVADDEIQRNAIIELIGNSDVETRAVGTGEEAIGALPAGDFDCMVLNLKLPDMSGFELVRRIRDAERFRSLPIIVYTGRELAEQEAIELKRLTETSIVKRAQSPEQLLDETALFLHRNEENLPEPKRSMIRKVHKADPQLVGRTVLIVDDDIRNIYATTNVLEIHQIQVLNAENGRQGIEVLERNPEIDLVLMDIIMPEMDGYEAIQRIRAKAEYKNFPVIALSAKAMKGDREKCIDVGASDYIIKPIDTEQLLSLLRVWLYR